MTNSSPGSPGWLARHIPRQPRNIAHAALAAFGLIASGVTVIAVIESYSNLLAFARTYGLSGWRAAIAPGAVDSFIIMGELLLFTAILLHWGKTAHFLGAGMAFWGFALSVGGNVWHAPVATAVDRAVSAVWPVTATAALAGALLIVRQIMMASAGAPASPVPGTSALPPDPDQQKKPPAGKPPLDEPPLDEPALPRARRGRAPAVAVDEQALLEEILVSGILPPSYRGWSFAKTGMYRSAPTKRVYDQARVMLDPGQARLDGDQGMLELDQAALSQDQAVLNGARHA